MHRIEIYSSKTQELLAVHNRSYGRGQESLVLDHYLDLLARKPGGLSNAKVIRHMPILWKELLAQMKKQLLRGDKEFIRTLILLRSYSHEVKMQTISQSVEQGLFIAEEIHDLARKTETQARGAVESTQSLADSCSDCVLVPNMTVYDRLLSEVITIAG